MSEYVPLIPGQIDRIDLYRIKKSLNKVVDIFKAIFTYLMVSSLFIAITGFFETYMGYLLLDVRPSNMICFAVFLMTFSVYSLDKITDSNEDAINMPERQSFLAGRRKYIFCYSIIAYALSALIILLDKPLALPIIFIPLAANAVYGSRIIPGMPRLKDVPVVKNFVVAISWALVTTLLPAMYMTEKASLVIALVFYFMLAKVFINAVLYDIRDVKGDQAMGVRTMPVLLGSRKTTAILLGINSTILPCLAYIGGTLRPLSALMILYGYIYILYFSEARSAMSLDFLVDGQWMIATVLFGLS